MKVLAGNDEGVVGGEEGGGGQIRLDDAEGLDDVVWEGGLEVAKTGVEVVEAGEYGVERAEGVEWLENAMGFAEGGFDVACGLLDGCSTDLS